MRSRDLSSIGGETDQNLPDDNMFEQEGEEAEGTDNEEDSGEESGTDNEPEEEKSTAQGPPPVKVTMVYYLIACLQICSIWRMGLLQCTLVAVILGLIQKLDCLRSER